VWAGKRREEYSLDQPGVVMFNIGSMLLLAALLLLT
jgi:hypothetical protein